jgi:hypothetical protein
MMNGLTTRTFSTSSVPSFLVILGFILLFLLLVVAVGGSVVRSNVGRSLLLRDSTHWAITLLARIG